MAPSTSDEIHEIPNITKPPIATPEYDSDEQRSAHGGGADDYGFRRSPSAWPSQENGRDDAEPFDYDYLNEITAPPPDENPEERRWYRRPTLEDRRLSAQLSKNKLGASGEGRTSKEPALLLQTYTVSFLVFFSILGTLARLGLQALTSYPNAPITINQVWTNVAGSFVLGFLQEDQWLFAARRGRNFSKRFIDNASNGPNPQNTSAVDDEKALHVQYTLQRKKALPLYIGLTVGFCGSLTSFSSFIRDAFLALANDLHASDFPPSPRHNVCGLASVFAVLIAEPVLSLAALTCGAHLAIALNPVLGRLPKFHTERFTNPISLPLALCSWLASIFLSAFPPKNSWRGDALFALAFAPLGCLLRFILAKRLNPRYASFPLGTFVANILGSVVLSACWDGQRVSELSGVGCQVLQGTQDGLAGTLTTVSTWVAELRGLRRRHAYVYGIVSIGVALAGMVVIMGPVRWTKGYSDGKCML